jgi:hypothetical protein
VSVSRVMSNPDRFGAVKKRARCSVALKNKIENVLLCIFRHAR